MSPSPDEYISYSINYLLFTFGKEVAFIYDSSPLMDAYNNIIISSFDVLNFEVSGLMKVNESNLSEDIVSFLENITYYGSSNSIIINTLTGESLSKFFELYKQYIVERVDLINLSKAYTVICFDYYTFKTINPDYTKNQYVISSRFVTQSNIQEKISDILTDSYIINGDEINILLSLYILSILYTSTESVEQSYIFQKIYDIDLDSPFGYLKMDKTNVLSRPISIYQEGSDGKLNFIQYTIEVSFDSQVWKRSYREERVFTCNWKESFSERYERSLIKIGLLISFSGAYSLQDISLYSSYLMGIDLCNIEYNGIRGLYIHPITIDVQSNESMVGEAILQLAENGVNFVFGLSKYLSFFFNL